MKSRIEWITRQRQTNTDNDNNKEDIGTDTDDEQEEQEGGAKVKSTKKSNLKTGAKKNLSNSKSQKTRAKTGSKKNSLKKNPNKYDRYFKFINLKTNESYGRYTGDTPKQAASKGYTKLLKKLKDEGKVAPNKTIIYVRESTRGSGRKIYGYEAYRQELPKPQELFIQDKLTGEEKKIVYNYRNKIKKVPVPDNIGIKNGKKKTTSKKSTSKGQKKPRKKSTGSKSTNSKKKYKKTS